MREFNYDAYIEMANNMQLDVYIPHNISASQLGKVYNSVMEKADGWVLFLDSDAMLLHPKWYDICMRAIYVLGDEAGFISCLTNRIGHALQRHCQYRGDDMKEHTQIAIAVEKSLRREYLDVTNDKGISGHFILTNKEVWSKSRKFKEGLGVLGTDNSYHYAVRDAGYKVFIMKDMYVYHRYARYWKGKNYKSGEWDR